LKSAERAMGALPFPGACASCDTIFDGVFVVVRGGVEPPTFRFSGGRSYRLSYLT
jgi:hypothetical protein